MIKCAWPCDWSILATLRMPGRKLMQRPLGDVFSLQSEITRAIAAKLQTRLSPNEKTILDTPPTTDLRAYDLYLQARALLSLGGPARAE